MKNLLEEWIEVCEERSEVDKSHFLGLIKEHSSPDELKVIFSLFPCADELAERTINVLSAGNFSNYLYLIPETTKNKGLVVECAKKWLKEQEFFFERKKNYEFSNICSNLKIEFVDREDLNKYYHADIPSRWFFDFISDEVRSSRIIKSRRIYYLYEALYGISADYYLAYYIMQPLLKVDINFVHYFDFWRNGGIGFITENSYLVSIIDPAK